MLLFFGSYKANLFKLEMLSIGIMKIGLVYAGKAYFEPLSLAVIAALTPKEHEVSIIHASEYNLENTYDLVGMTVLTSTAPRLYALADKIRKNGRLVVMGGIHPTFLPEEALMHSDSVVLHDAEGLWQQLLIDFQNDPTNFKRIYSSKEQPSLDGLIYPRQDLFKSKISSKTYRIEVSRGCKNRCNYCVPSAFNKGNLRNRPIDDIVKELGTTPKKEVVFIADNQTIDREYAINLFDAIKVLGKIWYGTFEIESCDETLLKKAKESGCFDVFVGIDSLSQATLISNGTSKKAETYSRFIKQAQDLGIKVRGGFVFGFDTDTPKTFDNAANFIDKNHIDARISILTPLPGTRLYDQLKDRIIDRDWTNYDLRHVVFRPKNLRPEELQDLYKSFCSKYVRGISRYV
jgi:radical SAM superfamily enzyme YgiQ (UPF0313 family)